MTSGSVFITQMLLSIFSIRFIVCCGGCPCGGASCGGGGGGKTNIFSVGTGKGSLSVFFLFPLPLILPVMLL
jgi:hypothetical protein